MTPGSLLVLLGFLAALGATGLLGRNALRGTDDGADAAEALVAGAAVSLFAALAYLTYQFVVTDYSNAYVWANTADYLPVLYRVTGVYAANAGSVLLWAALAALVALWAAAVRGVRGRSRALVQAVTMGVVAWFAGTLVARSPFESVAGRFPEAPEGYVPASGQGLNPLLVDPFMAIHPPVMFVSYALLTMPFAIGAAHFLSLTWRGEGIFADWIGSVTRWLRVSWLFLTAAVALGALWSYTVLGWGGIWAWDPVETAILVPWLFLTATVHAVTNYRAGERYTLLAPAMTATVFALAVYTTTVVRSGVFRSVHSFASGGIGAGMLLLMGLTALVGVVLPVGYWLAREEDDSGKRDRWLTRGNLLHLAVLGLGLLTFVSLWGLTFPVLRDLATGVEVAIEARYYNLWSYPVVLGLLLLLGFYMDFDVEGRRRSLVALGVTAVATLLAAVVVPGPSWTLGSPGPADPPFYRAMGGVSSLSVVPPAAYVAVAVLKRGMDRAAGVPRSVQLKETGITAIHLGVALLAVSLTFTYLFTTQASVLVQDLGGGEVSAEVPDSEYVVTVHETATYDLPRDPSLDSFTMPAGSVADRAGSLNGTVQAVSGRVSDVREGPRATVVRLDGSGTWLGVPNATAADLGVARGDRVVARGVVLHDYVPEAEAVVLTGAAGVGTPRSLPQGVDPTRVTVRAARVTVSDDDGRVMTGTVGQRRYRAQGGMQVRDVAVDRGPLRDTYVIAGLSDGTASVTVKRIPFMTPLRVAVLLLLGGMSLVALFDPRHGVWRREFVAGLRPEAVPDGDREVSSSD